MTAGRPRRSALYMPATNARAVAKARTLPCDVVILDLEDAVAPEAKEEARAQAVAAIAAAGFGHRELVVRVNGLDTPWGADDLAAVGRSGVDAVLLPKVAAPAALNDARARLGDGPALWAMVETAAAILGIGAIVAEDAVGLACLVAGTNDLAGEMRCRPGADRAPLLPALAQVVLAARMAGLAVLDGVANVIDDPAALARECRQGRDWGFDGKTLIHPAQIGAANQAFTPDPVEVARAARVVAAFDDPANAGKAAIRVDGRMVELLHHDEARRTLALAAACTAADA